MSPPARAGRRSAAPEAGTGLEVFSLRDAVVALSTEGELPPAALAALVETAMVDAHARLADGGDAVQAHVDLETGKFELFRIAEDGSREEVSALTPDFMRQAAQAVKAAVHSRRRDVERDQVVREVNDRRGQLVDAIVERREGAAWGLRVEGRHAAILPAEEQLQGEHLAHNQHLKVVIIDVRRGRRDAVIVASRSHPLLVVRLLEQEVPELANGQIVVKAIAREGGRRSKVAVHAPNGGIDPRGACIGPKGVRHRAVVGELSDEQVQIITWSDDQATFVANALAPATVQDVVLDEASHTAHVTVPPTQLSLAIGRSGENARLTARLTGWRIDIRSSEPDGRAGDDATGESGEREDPAS